MIEQIEWSNILAGAALGVAVIIGVRKISTVQKLKDDLDFIESCAREISTALTLSSEILKNDKTPSAVRDAMLLLLQGVRKPSVGEWIDARLSSQSKNHNPSEPGEITKAISRLREVDTALADKIESALVGLADVAIPLASRKRTFPRADRRITSPTQTLLAIDRTMPSTQRFYLNGAQPA